MYLGEYAERAGRRLAREVVCVDSIPQMLRMFWGAEALYSAVCTLLATTAGRRKGEKASGQASSPMPDMSLQKVMSEGGGRQRFGWHRYRMGDSSLVR